MSDFTRGMLPPGRINPRSMAAERVELPYDDPYDVDEVTETALAQADAAARGLLHAENRRRARVARSRRARAEVEQVTRQAGFARGSGMPMSAVSPAAEDNRIPPRPAFSQETEGLLPIFEPLHNAREIAKQLVLLEDHLVQPSKNCPDCIRKHLLAAEALAEEAVTLDRSGRHHALFSSAARQIRDICRSFLQNKDRAALQQRARQLRKLMSKRGFSALDKESAQQAGDPYLAAYMGSANVIDGVREGALVAYRYQDRWYPGRVLSGGQRYRDIQGRAGVAPTPNDGSRGLVVASVSLSSYGRPSLREEGVVVLSGPLSAASVLPLAPKRISKSLAGKAVPGFRYNGQPAPSDGPLTSDQLFMADLIQATLLRVVGADICRAVGVTNPNQLKEIGCAERAALQLARAAFVTAWYESRLDPSRSNLTGKDRSYGLFQLNRLGGLGKGHDPQRLIDPVYNTTVFAQEAKRILRRGFGPLVRREAALQPTTAGEWTRVVTLKIQRPAKMDLAAAARALTADKLFPARPAQQVRASQVVSSGMDLDPRAFAQAHPDIWRETRLSEAERDVQPILGKPSDKLTPAEVRTLSSAASLWQQTARDYSEIDALPRAVYLARYSGDVMRYKSALKDLSRMGAGTSQGAEADRLLADLDRTVPSSREDTIHVATIAGGVALGAVALYIASEGVRGLR
jgi:hypothetical protein